MDKDNIVGQIIDIATESNAYISEAYESLQKRYGNYAQAPDEIKNVDSKTIDKVIAYLAENYNAKKALGV